MSQHLEFPAASSDAARPAAAHAADPLARWAALPHDVPGLPGRPQRRRNPTRPAGAARPFTLVAMTLAVGLLTAIANPVGARGTELAPELARLATCEESWYDSRRDEARMGAFGQALRAQFRPEDRSPVWKPLAPVTWLGHEVLEITPQSVGMGLGFAVTLKAPSSAVRPAYEQRLGQAMERCESSDGLHSCERTLAPKRTAIMMAPLKKPEAGTLVGCYYFYEP